MGRFNFSIEPVAWSAAAIAVLQLGVLFGLELPNGWQAAVNTAIIAVAAVVARAKVVPVPRHKADVQEALFTNPDRAEG
jgi:hypothetical protein